MKIRFTITGIDCPNCAAKLADKMAKLDGIDNAKINFLTEKLTIETQLDEDKALAIIYAEAKAFSRDIVIEK